MNHKEPEPDVDLRECERRRSSNVPERSELEQARARTDRAVIEAEKFRATTADPGINFNMSEIRKLQEPENYVKLGKVQQEPDTGIPNIGVGVSDDDFFHLTCHIDPTLIHKIEKGGFVELEKLLPKDKIGWNSEESRFEWVQRDGGMYLVPAQRDNKISSFRQWEQAFRAYATIYCGGQSA